MNSPTAKQIDAPKKKETEKIKRAYKAPQKNVGMKKTKTKKNMRIYLEEKILNNRPQLVKRTLKRTWKNSCSSRPQVLSVRSLRLSSLMNDVSGRTVLNVMMSRW